MTTAVSSPALVQRTGITERRLYYWTDMGYIRTADPHPGSGYGLTFLPGEVAVVALAVALADAGILAGQAFDLARDLLTAGRAPLAGLQLTLPEYTG